MSTTKLTNRPYSLILGCLLSLVSVAVFSAPALAARGHVRSTLPAFGGACTVSPCEGLIKEPTGIAINEESDIVYVLDKGTNRVVRYSSSGTYLGEINGSGTLPEESANGKEAEGIAAGGGLRSDEEPTGEYEQPEGIAIDNSCAQHKPLPLPEPKCKESDPSNGDVYVEDGFARKVIDKYTAGGRYLGQITAQDFKTPKLETLRHLGSIAVDPAGEVWVTETHREGGSLNPIEGVDSFSDSVVNGWTSFRPTEIPGGALEHGLAVDTHDNLYLRYNEVGEVAEFGSQGELIEKTVGGESPSGVAYGGVAVEPPSGDVYVDNFGSVGRFGPSAGGTSPEVEQLGAGELTSSVCDPFSPASCAGGVAVDSANGDVYVVDSADQVFQYVEQQPAAPKVENESVEDVTEGSATLSAEINPESIAGEPETKYQFQYGECSSVGACATSGYGPSVPVPAGLLAPTFDVEAVSAPVQGLLPGRTYHFRVLAENEVSKNDAADQGKPVVGPEEVFTTRGTGVFALADQRQWQLVSPPDKHGALIEPIGEAWPIQAAANGDAITYATDAPTESEPAGYSNFQQVLSSRTSGGWSTQDIAIPHTGETGVSIGFGQEYRFFSEDLSQAVVQPFGPFIACQSSEGVAQPCLSQQASEQTPFLRGDFTGSAGEQCTHSCFTPLVTGADGLADVPPGTVFAAEGACQNTPVVCGPQFLDATADGAHVLLGSDVRLTETPVAPGSRPLYEWSSDRPAGERLQLVSILPGEHEGVRGAALGLEDLQRRRAVSADGSLVVFVAEAHLYLRDLVSEETTQLDSGLSGEPLFQTGSADLSVVYFTEGGDLYEYNVAKKERVDIAPAGSVLGSVIGASENGATVYFVANGVLAAGAVNGNCTNVGNASQLCNLYVDRDGTTSLVAVLSGADFPDWNLQLSALTARVSPDGAWLAFMSQRSFTGYDNRDAASANRDEEVFLYYAPAERLTCVSCNPTGARPHGIEYGVEGNGVIPNMPLVGGDGVWQGTTWLAGNIPGWTPETRRVSLYQSRYLSDSGRLFFDSSDALVPKDVNGGEDVYEFEPEGIESPEGKAECSQATASGSDVYIPQERACVALISSGSSAQESAFLDASESGGDVFFMTAAKLAPQDTDTAFDVYDAHECTAESPCLPEPAATPPPCNTEASCKAAPSPQPNIFGPSGSATFSGIGNVPPTAPAAVVKAKAKPPTRAQKLAKALKACAKDRSKAKRTKCQAAEKEKYAPLKTKKKGKQGKS